MPRRSPPFRLAPWPLKRQLLPDVAIVPLAFDAALAATAAGDFIADHLRGRLNAAHVIVGDGFTFGRGRQGTIDLLRARRKGRAGKALLALRLAAILRDRAGIDLLVVRPRAGGSGGKRGSRDPQLFRVAGPAGSRNKNETAHPLIVPVRVDRPP